MNNPHEAQPAPEVDVFEAFNWAGVEGYPDVEEWFGPAIKALEEIDEDKVCAQPGEDAERACRRVARKALTALRERARRVGQ